MPPNPWPLITATIRFSSPGKTDAVNAGQINVKTVGNEPSPNVEVWKIPQQMVMTTTMTNVDVKKLGIHSSESIFTITNVAERHTKYPIKQPMKRTSCEIFFAKIAVTKQKIRFVIMVEMPSDDIQNFCKSLNSKGDDAQPAASEMSSTIGIWRVSLSTATVKFIIILRVVDSTATFVALAQSDRCSLVIQYSKGVMKKFHGSRVAVL